jgi:hypothetical protein
VFLAPAGPGRDRAAAVRDCAFGVSLGHGSGFFRRTGGGRLGGTGAGHSRRSDGNTGGRKGGRGQAAALVGGGMPRLPFRSRLAGDFRAGSYRRVSRRSADPRRAVQAQTRCPSGHLRRGEVGVPVGIRMPGGAPCKIRRGGSGGGRQRPGDGLGRLPPGRCTRSGCAVVQRQGRAVVHPV